MRHGPNKLIFNSAEALRGRITAFNVDGWITERLIQKHTSVLTSLDIYNNERITKSHVYLLTSAAGNPSIFNTLDRHQHSIKRRLVGQAVNEKAMREFEPTMTEQIDVFLGQIQEASKTSTPLDMTDHLKRLGMDIVGLLAFGFPLNLQTDPTYRFMTKGLSLGGYRAHAVSTYQEARLAKLATHRGMVSASKVRANDATHD